MKPILALGLCLAAMPAAAETVLGSVTGNWAAPDNTGFYYRAVLTAEGDFARLRIWQGMTPDTIEAEPQFDNPRIAYRGQGSAAMDWLEVGDNGELRVLGLSEIEGYVYTTELVVHYMDNQFTAMRYGFYNNRPGEGDVSPPDPASCWAAECYACEADLWNRTAVAGGERIAIPDRPLEEFNASLWEPGREFTLEACPAPN